MVRIKNILINSFNADISFVGVFVFFYADRQLSWLKTYTKGIN